MLFTLGQLESLESAIIQETLRVKYQDREVRYRCLEDMLRLREKMMSSVFLNKDQCQHSKNQPNIKCKTSSI